MESKVFACGRYKGKTYQEVYDLDKSFCSMILQQCDHKYAPKDFKQFLISKNKKRQFDGDIIEERLCQFFVQKLKSNHIEEFKDLIGDLYVNTDQVHEPCDKTFQTNGFLSKFYNFFTMKTVFNLKNEDGYCYYSEYCSSGFPFSVSDKVLTIDFDDIITLFSESTKNVMQEFLDLHCGNVEFLHIFRLFLSNIYHFRKNKFSNRDLKQLQLVVTNRYSKNDYLKNFPRITDLEYSRFMTLYENFVQVSTIFNRECVFKEYDKFYFINLPEINFYELFFLLEADSFKKDSLTYLKNLQKYLFFFVNAIRSEESSPIFFIDDLLFETLKSYAKFRKSRDDVFDLLDIFAMMTLTNLRQFPLDSENVYKFSKSNLKLVKNYLEHLSGINTAIVCYNIVTDILEAPVLLYLTNQDVFIETCFSVVKETHVTDFFQLIISASLCNKNIKRLVLYNAYLGQETSVSIPEINKKGIRNFIRKYNKYEITEENLPDINIFLI